MILLFLDDIRNPLDAYSYTNFSLFLKENWNIVRNHDQFVEWITTNGLPEFISFDHDLADSYHTLEYLWGDYNLSKEWQEAPVHTEKTGYDCAKWLVEYCLNNKLNLPQYYCHSMNPVGKDNILNYLNNFKKVDGSCI